MSYFDQVKLLVSVLPYVAKQNCFALKGGTALNLFIRDLPRLSVDIDLTYLPVQDRNTSLNHIELALHAIASEISEKIPSTHVVAVLNPSTKKVDKLNVEQNEGRYSVASITIEVNPVIRGCVYAPEIRDIMPRAQQAYGFARITTLNFADLYARKIVAALDRQHPRDLFDVKLLFENEGLDEKLKNAFLVYSLSSDRPIAEILSPRLKDIRPIYEAQFVGMTTEPVTREALEEVRKELVKTIHSSLTESDRDNLLAIKRGDIDWSLFPVNGVEKLPAIQWKLFNLANMAKDKRELALDKLAKVLYPPNR